MAKSRKEKEDIVADLSQKFQDAKAIVFAKVDGYTMSDANALRDLLASEGGLDSTMAKKTLLEIAAKNAGYSLDRANLDGSIVTIFGYEDEVAAARVAAKFGKDHESFALGAGILEGAFVDVEKVKAFAELPSREELLAKVVGSLNAPVSGFVNVLAGNMRGLMNALNAIKEAKA